MTNKLLILYSPNEITTVLDKLPGWFRGLATYKCPGQIPFTPPLPQHRGWLISDTIQESCVWSWTLCWEVFAIALNIGWCADSTTHDQPTVFTTREFHSRRAPYVFQADEHGQLGLPRRSVARAEGCLWKLVLPLFRTMWIRSHAPALNHLGCRPLRYLKLAIAYRKNVTSMCQRLYQEHFLIVCYSRLIPGGTQSDRGTFDLRKAMGDGQR